MFDVRPFAPRADERANVDEEMPDIHRGLRRESPSEDLPRQQ